MENRDKKFLSDKLKNHSYVNYEAINCPLRSKDSDIGSYVEPEETSIPETFTDSQSEEHEYDNAGLYAMPH